MPERRSASDPSQPDQLPPEAADEQLKSVAYETLSGLSASQNAREIVDRQLSTINVEYLLATPADPNWKASDGINYFKEAVKIAAVATYVLVGARDEIQNNKRINPAQLQAADKILNSALESISSLLGQYNKMPGSAESYRMLSGEIARIARFHSFAAKEESEHAMSNEYQAKVEINRVIEIWLDKNNVSEMLDDAIALASTKKSSADFGVARDAFSPIVDDKKPAFPTRSTRSTTTAVPTKAKAAESASTSRRRAETEAAQPADSLHQAVSILRGHLRLQSDIPKDVKESFIAAYTNRYRKKETLVGAGQVWSREAQNKILREEKDKIFQVATILGKQFEALGKMKATTHLKTKTDTTKQALAKKLKENIEKIATGTESIDKIAADLKLIVKLPEEPSTKNKAESTTSTGPRKPVELGTKDYKYTVEMMNSARPTTPDSPRRIADPKKPDVYSGPARPPITEKPVEPVGSDPNSFARPPIIETPAQGSGTRAGVPTGSAANRVRSSATTSTSTNNAASGSSAPSSGAGPSGDGGDDPKKPGKSDVSGHAFDPTLGGDTEDNDAAEVSNKSNDAGIELVDLSQPTTASSPANASTGSVTSASNNSVASSSSASIGGGGVNSSLGAAGAGVGIGSNREEKSATSAGINDLPNANPEVEPVPPPTAVVSVIDEPDLTLNAPASDAAVASPVQSDEVAGSNPAPLAVATAGLENDTVVAVGNAPELDLGNIPAASEIVGDLKKSAGGASNNAKNEPLAPPPAIPKGSPVIPEEANANAGGDAEPTDDDSGDDSEESDDEDKVENEDEDMNALINTANAVINDMYAVLEEVGLSPLTPDLDAKRTELVGGASVAQLEQMKAGFAEDKANLIAAVKPVWDAIAASSEDKVALIEQLNLAAYNFLIENAEAMMSLITARQAALALPDADEAAKATFMRIVNDIQRTTVPGIQGFTGRLDAVNFSQLDVADPLADAAAKKALLVEGYGLLTAQTELLEQARAQLLNVSEDDFTNRYAPILDSIGIEIGRVELDLIGKTQTLKAQLNAAKAGLNAGGQAAYQSAINNLDLEVAQARGQPAKINLADPEEEGKARYRAFAAEINTKYVEGYNASVRAAGSAGTLEEAKQHWERAYQIADTGFNEIHQTYLTEESDPNKNLKFLELLGNFRREWDTNYLVRAHEEIQALTLSDPDADDAAKATFMRIVNNIQRTTVPGIQEFTGRLDAVNFSQLDVADPLADAAAKKALLVEGYGLLTAQTELLEQARAQLLNVSEDDFTNRYAPILDSIGIEIGRVELDLIGKTTTLKEQLNAAKAGLDAGGQAAYQSAINNLELEVAQARGQPAKINLADSEEEGKARYRAFAAEINTKYVKWYNAAVRAAGSVATLEEAKQHWERAFQRAEAGFQEIHQTYLREESNPNKNLKFLELLGNFRKEWDANYVVRAHGAIQALTASIESARENPLDAAGIAAARQAAIDAGERAANDAINMRQPVPPPVPPAPVPDAPAVVAGNVADSAASSLRESSFEWPKNYNAFLAEIIREARAQHDALTTWRSTYPNLGLQEVTDNLRAIKPPPADLNQQITRVTKLFNDAVTYNNLYQDQPIADVERQIKNNRVTINDFPNKFSRTFDITRVVAGQVKDVAFDMNKRRLLLSFLPGIDNVRHYVEKFTEDEQRPLAQQKLNIGEQAIARKLASLYKAQVQTELDKLERHEVLAYNQQKRVHVGMKPLSLTMKNPDGSPRTLNQALTAAGVDSGSEGPGLSISAGEREGAVNPDAKEHDDGYTQTVTADRPIYYPYDHKSAGNEKTASSGYVVSYDEKTSRYICVDKGESLPHSIEKMIYDALHKEAVLKGYKFKVKAAHGLFDQVDTDFKKFAEGYKTFLLTKSIPERPTKESFTAYCQLKKDRQECQYENGWFSNFADKVIEEYKKAEAVLDAPAYTYSPPFGSTVAKIGSTYVVASGAGAAAANYGVAGAALSLGAKFAIGAVVFPPLLIPAVGLGVVAGVSAIGAGVYNKYGAEQLTIPSMRRLKYAEEKVTNFLSQTGAHTMCVNGREFDPEDLKALILAATNKGLKVDNRTTLQYEPDEEARKKYKELIGGVTLKEALISNDVNVKEHQKKGELGQQVHGKQDVPLSRLEDIGKAQTMVQQVSEELKQEHHEAISRSRPIR